MTVMAAGLVPLLQPPCVDDYFTDGSVLVQIVGINGKGDYECEDACSGEFDIIETVELTSGKWRLVNGR